MSNKKIFDNVAENYDELLLKNLGSFGKDISYYNEYKCKVMQFHLNQKARKAPKKIFEFGCGTGNNIHFLLQYFPDSKIDAFDISPESIYIAKSRYNQNANVTFSINLDTFLKEDNQGYDLILVAGVLHHIPKTGREDVLKNLYKLLSPEGNVYIFEHNPLNPVTRKLVKECPFDEGVELLTPSEMNKYTSDVGFSKTKIRYSLFFPARFKKMFPLEKFIYWLPFGGHFYTILSK